MVELANRTPGSNATAEVKRLHGLWDEAAQVDTSLQADGAPYGGHAATLPQDPVVTTGRLLPQTLLLAELEASGRQNDREQAGVRMLYGLLERVAMAAGIGQQERYREDRGDGVIELIDPTFPVDSLLGALLTVLPKNLNAINHRLPHANWIRMRLVLATGNVFMDDHGAGGAALDEASRLLDSAVLREALRERNRNYALCVSEPVYWATRHQNRDGVSAAEFHEITVSTKAGTRQAWLHQPAHP
ncbi:hypothetical protein ABZ093_36360 [Streptomyces cyaneofuscatus]|uniref:hypothetical protein n=1 Tax=Streptomyces cyaneofuscatus TaxID=66883 RepID=UPI0033B993E6